MVTTIPLGGGGWVVGGQSDQQAGQGMGRIPRGGGDNGYHAWTCARGQVIKCSYFIDVIILFY